MGADRRRLQDRVLEDSFIQGLGDRSIEELRELRDQAREAETEASFERRLCQARIDILHAELDSRTTGRDADVLQRLNEILATEGAQTHGPLPERAPHLSMPRNADVPRRRVEEVIGEQVLARLPTLSEEEIKETVKALAAREREVSARRSRVQQVMDTIQAEIVRRYVSGEADPSAALS